MARSVKNLSAVQEMQVQSLLQEGPLEEGVANHSSIPAWRIPWTEEPVGLQSIGLQRVGNDRSNLAFSFSLFDTYYVSDISSNSWQKIQCLSPLSL